MRVHRHGSKCLISLLLSIGDRAALHKIIEGRGWPVKHVQRAQIVLLSADRLPVLEIANRVGISRLMVWRWQQAAQPNRLLFLSSLL